MVPEVELLRQHAEVLFDMDPDGRLLKLNEPGDKPAPRLFLVRGRRSHQIWFRVDVPEATAETWREIARGLPHWDGEPSNRAVFDALRAAVIGDAPIGVEWHVRPIGSGNAWTCTSTPRRRSSTMTSAHLLDRHFSYTRSVLAARSPVVGAIIEGRAVAVCFSARQRSTAAEAGVATEEPYRGRGLAPLVVSAWRVAVERAGGQSLYSASWDNVASRAVAAKLRLIAYAETFSLT